MKAILFDLDETLHDRAASLELYIAEHHTRLQFSEMVALETYRERFIALDERGYADKNWLFHSLVSEFGLKIQATELLHDFRTELGKNCALFSDAVSTLQELRKRGYKLGIVTNGTVLMQSTKLTGSGLLPLVDIALISEQEGIKKPAPEIFLRAAMQLVVEPQECIFVGDHPLNDIGGARNVGLKTAWLRGVQTWPATLDFAPDITLNTLSELLDCLYFPAISIDGDVRL